MLKILPVIFSISCKYLANSSFQIAYYFHTFGLSSSSSLQKVLLDIKENLSRKIRM